MRDFGSRIKKLTSVLIRPGAMVRIHHGPLIASANLLRHQHCTQ